MRKPALLAVIGLLAATLVACTSQPGEQAQAPAETPQQGVSRYQDAYDGAPLKHIEPEDVTDAVPSPDPILTAGNKSPYTVNGVTYQVMSDHSDYRARGIASWYGTKFHGHETSNGERYDLYQASAAHKTLPIPCFARVTNLDNGRSIVVRVNDRGPFHSDRLIDLSYAAAVKLGYMETGTARVEVEVIDIAGVDDRRGSVAGDYRFLQLGAYSSADKARSLQDKLQALLAPPVFISEVEAGGNLLYRVRVGPMTAAGELQTVQEQLRLAGYDAGQPLP
jgi:rare lipoprotein A